MIPSNLKTPLEINQYLQAKNREMVKEFLIVGDTMFLLKNSPIPSGFDTLEFGAISSVGNYVSTNGLSLLKTYFDPPQMLVNSSTNELCLFERGASPHMLSFDDPINLMTNSTPILSFLNPAPSVANIEWNNRLSNLIPSESVVS